MEWDRLAADLRGQHLPLEAVPAAATAYGQKYVIRATLVGPSGASAEVVTIESSTP